MLSPTQIRDTLAAGASAALNQDRGGLERLERWLSDVSAQEFLRIDVQARNPYESVLGPRDAWSARAFEAMPDAAAAIASMHPSGYVRERAVSRLSVTDSPSTNRALATRVDDHVSVVREAAAREVLRRTTRSQAADLVPILSVLSGRTRGGDVLRLYLFELVDKHGEDAVWRTLRASSDRSLRRSAFRHSASTGLLGVDEAVRNLPRERDQVVRHTLTQVIADSKSPELIAAALLRAGAAESRAIGLVRLTADQVSDVDARRLLTDSSVLVRLWARTRWSEKGRDPEVTYREVVAGDPRPVIQARAFRGIAESGGNLDHEVLLGLIREPEPALRRVGLELLATCAVPEDASLLADLVESDNSGVARRAADALATLPPRVVNEAVQALRASESAVTRHRVWRLLRRVGDAWDRTLVDLEMTFDQDDSNAARAREVVRAPVFGQPSEAQRGRVERLLARAPGQFRGIAFAAGVGIAEPTIARAEVLNATPTSVFRRALSRLARRRER